MNPGQGNVHHFNFFPQRLPWVQTIISFFPFLIVRFNSRHYYCCLPLQRQTWSQRWQSSKPCCYLWPCAWTGMGRFSWRTFERWLPWNHKLWGWPKSWRRTCSWPTSWSCMWRSWAGSLDRKTGRGQRSGWDPSRWRTGGRLPPPSWTLCSWYWLFSQTGGWPEEEKMTGGVFRLKAKRIFGMCYLHKVDHWTAILNYPRITGLNGHSSDIK